LIELRTLGSLDLRQDGREVRAVLQQPKRLALLAYLAINTPRRFHRRDALLGLFWPELDQNHARAALRRAIYFLRQALGDDVIVGRGDEELAIQEAGFFADVAAFENALAKGDFIGALDLYRGDLLEGFYVSLAPEFERWLDIERVRLRDRAASAVKALMDEAERKNDLAGAVAWAMRLVTLSPFDEVAFRRLAGLLERGGDRAGALKAYESFTQRLREAYEIEPSSETQSLITQIRNRQAVRAKPKAPEQPPGIVPSPAPSAPRSIAVLPFNVRGSPGLAYLSEGMVDLLSTKLEGAGDLRTIDPRALLTFLQHENITESNPESGRTVASRFGAGFYLLGSVVEAGGRLQISGTLYRQSGELVAVGETRGGVENEIFELVDDFARQLLADKSRTTGSRVGRLAAITTGSLPALKAYLRGEQHFRQARYFDAMDVFQQALVQDSEFALAYYRLAAAQAASAMPEPARESAARAHDHRERLAAHDRLLLDAQRTWLSGSASQAESLYHAIVANFPDDMEAWFLLGDLMFHSNPLRGRSVVEARHPFERAIDLDPDHVTALVHLVRIAALEGRTDERDRLIDRVIGLSPDGDRAMPMRALRAFAHKETAEMTRVTADLMRARTLTVGVAFSDIALYSGNLAGAEQLVRDFLGTTPNDDAKALSHFGLAHLLMAQQRGEEARQHLKLGQAIEPAWGLELRALFAVLPFVTPDPAALGEIARELSEWDTSRAKPSHNLPLAIHNGLHEHLRVYLLGLIAARSGDPPEASRFLSELENLPSPTIGAAAVANLAASLKGAMAWARGDATATLRALDSSRTEIWFQFTVGSPFFSQALDRYTRGEALLALGRKAEAEGWLRSIGERTPIELIYRDAAAAKLR
jgi:DNA-binding SARP family transcriptional activator/TolB-like protein/TolA-binding protein